jgi:predicted nucleotidyltransferase
MKKFFEFKKSDLKPTNSFKIKDKLNPSVWDKFEMKEEIREQLIKITNEYLSMVYGTFEVVDIILTGSMASYNWSKYSDFDIHIKIDYKDINENDDLVNEYLKLLSKKFNREFDLKILGYDIELFVEDITKDDSHIHGIYSILKGKWNKKPNLDEMKKIDIKYIELKASIIMEEADRIELLLNKKPKSELKELASKLWTKIKKGRKDGIESPEGEFSIGNLVFKYLRRNGYIEKIINLKKQIVQDEYSI